MRRRTETHRDLNCLSSGIWFDPDHGQELSPEVWRSSAHRVPSILPMGRALEWFPDYGLQVPIEYLRRSASLVTLMISPTLIRAVPERMIFALSSTRMGLAGMLRMRWAGGLFAFGEGVPRRCASRDPP